MLDRTVRILTLALVGLRLSACGSDASPLNDEASIARSDSAGIEIVEITDAYLHQLPVWRISDEPVLSIGEVDGEEPCLFSAMIRGGVTALADGRIAIVDGTAIRGTAEVRIFDQRGGFVRSIGGRGEGPGEFARLPSVRARPDGGAVGQTCPSYAP